MSMIVIYKHNETIYNILKKTRRGHEQAAGRITSKTKQKVKKEWHDLEKKKKTSATMGLGTAEPSDPSKFLKKGSRKLPEPPPKDHTRQKVSRLPPLPKFNLKKPTKKPAEPPRVRGRPRSAAKGREPEKSSEQKSTPEKAKAKAKATEEAATSYVLPDGTCNICGVIVCKCAEKKTAKKKGTPDAKEAQEKGAAEGEAGQKGPEEKKKRDFLTENVRGAVKGDVRRLSDIRKAEQLAKQSHKFQKGYGNIPKYLAKYVKAKQKAKQQKKDSKAKQQPKCKYVTKEERDHLLEGLKQNWNELQNQYQKLPILTDTIPKKMRKTKLEEELKQLEKDICLVERHHYIYVYDDKKIG